MVIRRSGGCSEWYEVVWLLCDVFVECDLVTLKLYAVNATVIIFVIVLHRIVVVALL